MIMFVFKPVRINGWGLKYKILSVLLALIIVFCLVIFLVSFSKRTNQNPDNRNNNAVMVSSRKKDLNLEISEIQKDSEKELKFSKFNLNYNSDRIKIKSEDQFEIVFGYYENQNNPADLTFRCYGSNDQNLNIVPFTWDGLLELRQNQEHVTRINQPWEVDFLKLQNSADLLEKVKIITEKTNFTDSNHKTWYLYLFKDNFCELVLNAYDEVEVTKFEKLLSSSFEITER